METLGDSKEYKRGKVWACNKLRTLDKLPKDAHGSFIYTLLSGKALEAIEHLEPESYQKEGVEAVIWALLKVDELGEILGEVLARQREVKKCVRSASEKPM